jgi:hypothetical protein
MIERIGDGFGGLLAIIIRSGFRGEGHNFVTDPQSPMQLGVNAYRAGQHMEPHIHQPRHNFIDRTQEFVYVKSGHVRLILPETDPMTVRELFAGDCLLLVSGCHGFDVLEDSEIINVKQGPYDAAADKVLYSVAASESY